MLSKSLTSTLENAKHEKICNFVDFYKTSALQKDSMESNNCMNDTSLQQSVGKNTKKISKGGIVNLTKIDIDGQNLITSASGSNKTSNQNLSKRNLIIKSIMKDTPNLENSLDVSHVPRVNRKKRNKSVSFVLEDNDLVVKKTKSDESVIPQIVKIKHKVKINKMKPQKEDKENDLKIDLDPSENKIILDSKIKSPKSLINKTKKNIIKTNKKRVKNQVKVEENNLITDNDPHEDTIKNTFCKIEKNSKDNILKNDKTGRTKKNDIKNRETCENTASIIEKEISGIDLPKIKKLKFKKKKTKSKPLQDVDNASPTDVDINNAKQIGDNIMDGKKSKRSRKNKQNEGSEIGEPENKTFKKSKGDSIAEGIENLNIGDNAHTLTNLLGGMAVTKINKKGNKREKEASNQKSEVKGKSNRNVRRRRNKKTNAAVLVQNLPFRILLSYKQKLRELFSKYGSVQSIGIADLKCNENEAKPIFTTRVFFKTEEEATAALDGDKELFEGNIIRVKKFMIYANRTFRPSSLANKFKRDLELNTTVNSKKETQVEKSELLIKT